MKKIINSLCLVSICTLIISCGNTAKLSPYIQSVTADGSRIVKERALDIFVERNIPEAYEARKSDEEVFVSKFGVTEQEAIEHYTTRFIAKSQTEDMQILSETSPVTVESEVPDDAVEEVRQKLNDIDTSLSADIQRQEKNIKVDASTTCYIAFHQGKYDIDPSLGNNRLEIERIRGIIAALTQAEEFEIDSVVVTASASPEGSLEINRALTQKRSEVVSLFFGADIGIHFIAKYEEENWDMLDALIVDDVVMTLDDKISYVDICEIEDLDIREEVLQQQSYYSYLNQALYPRLRFLRFDFHMHYME